MSVTERSSVLPPPQHDVAVEKSETSRVWGQMASGDEAEPARILTRRVMHSAPLRQRPNASGSAQGLTVRQEDVESKGKISQSLILKAVYDRLHFSR